MRANPLLVETLRGIAAPGRAQSDYLNYLLIQAIVVVVWWPKDALLDALGRGQVPDTLRASVLAAGAAVAYFSVRAGAEEVRLTGQHGIREWALASPLSLGRVLAGYLQAQVVLAAYLTLLATPPVLMAFAVSGGEWAPLAWCFAAILFQATFYRLAGAVVYLAIGHHAAMTFLGVRAILIVTYVASAVLVPLASHVVLSARLLRLEVGPPDAGEWLTASLGFLALYAAASMLLVLVMYRQLSRDMPPPAVPVTSP